MFSTPPETALCSSFQYADQSGFLKGFLWARMRLFEDHIEFVGLGWRGRHRRTLPLDQVKDLRWHTGSGASNFALYLHDIDEDGESCIRVQVEGAGLWKHEVEARAPNLEATEAKLPDASSSRARAA